MAVRRPEREYHTRFGWWVMTHDRGGAAIIGLAALAAVTSDAIYVATRWHGFDSTFGRGFVSGFVGLVVIGLVGRALSGHAALGDDRDLARKRARRNNVAGVIALLLFVSLPTFGASYFSPSALILGSLAALGFFFAFSGLLAIRRPRQTP
jgi:hypothetical protein